ncbi:MAG: hypothetical protein MI864_20015, partial [Pseudomonadales bacterium]|nr:hypothetical protein [Pseudomonadales bacterium]
QIKAYLHNGRFAGGQIVDYNRLDDLDSIENVKHELGSGFVVVERNDLLQEHRGNPVEHGMKLVSNAYRDLERFVKRELNEDQAKQAMVIINKTQETKLVDLEIGESKEEIKDLNLEQHVAFVINDLLDYLDYQRRHTWLSLTMLGHQLLTAPKARDRVRGNYEHAFSEPVVGLIQYKSLNEIEVSDFKHSFWIHTWKSPNLFVFTQAGV